ncbi:hypothetical protein J2T13_004194 [Paenibacillus sp. DS2015]|uniref:hypothetical protein n=1 Tax=Paenibacillus sp. DS2015 TaxID=3373917 RepID=UPI003D21F492
MIGETEASATFYQYKLIKKVPVSKTLLMCYMLLPCIALIMEVTLLHWTSIFYFILAAPIVLWIQYVISRSVLLIAGFHYHKRWGFSLKLPWLGYMPNQHISYSLFRKVYFHTGWIGLVVPIILIFWSPVSFIISFLFWHVWYILPKLYIYAKLSRKRKDGMIKFNDKDISYYQQ